MLEKHTDDRIVNDYNAEIESLLKQIKYSI